YLAEQNTATGSPYYGKVATDQVAASGHSQGGGGAIAAGDDPRVRVTIPLEPSTRGSIALLHGPMLILAGQDDGIVDPAGVKEKFRAADQIPAVYGELAGAGHFTPLGDGGGFRAPTTAWFRYQLM